MTDASPIALPHPLAAPAIDGPLPKMRTWFALFLAWMSGLAFVALLLFERYEQGDPLALRAWLLALMCFYISLCNTLVPLPTTWIILLAASPDYALVQSGWLRVLVVAGLSTGATVVANLNEYHLLAYIFRFGLGRRLRRTRLFGWAIRWFDRAPFQLLALIAFVPIPIDAIRWLAVLRGYSRVRFACAYFIGRGPRYVLFAWCSVLLALTGWQILMIQVAMLVAVLLGRVIWSTVRRGRRRSLAGAPPPAETTIEAAASAAPHQKPHP